MRISYLIFLSFFVLILKISTSYSTFFHLCTLAADRKLGKKSKKSKKLKSTVPPTIIEKVECGDILEENVLLLEDLECDCQRGPGSTFAALTLIGPAILDLNGNTVSCTDNSWDTTQTDLSSVISVVGRGGVVFNGSVSKANFGIVLQGFGHHTVEGVVVFDTSNDGLQVNSPFCEVIDNTLFDNGLGFYSTEQLLAECEGDLVQCEFVEDECPEDFDPENPSAIPCFNGDVSGDGIDIGEGSQFSVVRNNVIKNFGDDGLSCRGNYNIIIKNDVSITEFTPRTSKSEDGITTRGFNNQVIDNIIQNTNKDGIDVKFNEDDNDCDQEFTGGYNIISFNEVKAPADGKGIKIVSNNNFVVLNKVESVQNDAGFNIDTSDCDIGGNRNYLADNQSTGNAEAGFKIEETNNNVVVRNTATGNQEEGFVLAVEEISGEIRGLANILAGNNASGNEAGRDFRQKGDDAVACTQNAYIGNVAPSTDEDATSTPACTLGEPINLQLQDNA